MLSNTLIVYTADNGGPIATSADASPVGTGQPAATVLITVLITVFKTVFKTVFDTNCSEDSHSPFFKTPNF
jgi:hypothetical protein